MSLPFLWRYPTIQHFTFSALEIFTFVNRRINLLLHKPCIQPQIEHLSLALTAHLCQNSLTDLEKHVTTALNQRLFDADSTIINCAAVHLLTLLHTKCLRTKPFRVFLVLEHIVCTNRPSPHSYAHTAAHRVQCVLRGPDITCTCSATLILSAHRPPAHIKVIIPPQLSITETAPSPS